MMEQLLKLALIGRGLAFGDEVTVGVTDAWLVEDTVHEPLLMYGRGDGDG